jgi:hypothetical protein
MNTKKLPSYERKEFCLLFFHEFGGIGFEVEAEEGFGVGRTDVEPPVGVFDFETIKFVLFAVGILGLERGEDSIFVMDFTVDFP